MDVSVESLEYWHWLTLGILLLIAEIAVGGVSFLLWIGFAALFTGVVTLVLPGLLVWQAQLFVFGVSSVAGVLLWRRYIKDEPVAGGVVLNKRGADHIGKVVLLEEAIANGSGRVRIDDTLWSVTGADAPAGSKVRIVALDGNTFQVEPAAQDPCDTPRHRTFLGGRDHCTAIQSAGEISNVKKKCRSALLCATESLLAG